LEIRPPGLFWGRDIGEGDVFWGVEKFENVKRKTVKMIKKKEERGKTKRN
jgi:hypothetical protein